MMMMITLRIIIIRATGDLEAESTASAAATARERNAATGTREGVRIVGLRG